MSLLNALADTAQSAPPGSGPLPPAELFWLHLASDAAIGLACYAIAAALLVLARRRRDLGMRRALAVFAAFLLAVGTVHLLRIWLLWHPEDGAAGAIKGATALIVVATAAALCLLLPRALAVPNPERLTPEARVRRAAVSRALASEARLSDAFLHLADAVFITARRPDGSFGYETVNPAFERLFGVAAAEVFGRGPGAAVAEQATAAQIEGHYARALASKAPVEYEASAVTRAGERRWHTVLVPMRGRDGSLTRLLGSVRDVTETRRLQADLQEAARMATIGSMCAGVAHEMSQPVNVVSLWAGNARAALDAGRADPRRLRRTLDVVLDQSRRIGTLLERMRELTREGQGAPDGTAAAPGGERFDAAEIVAAAAGIAGRQYALDGTEVSLDRPPDPVILRGQGAKLEQALLQLLANAHDAIAERRAREPEAPARIAVALRADRDAGVVAIAVRDTGGGVPAALRERIFDPFFTTRDPGRGTGLGLAIALGIAHSLGGRIENWNEAEPGAEAGAVFCLTLPLVSQTAQPAAPAVLGNRGVIGAAMRDAAPRILVAEDEPLAALAIEDMLLDAGFAVLLAADGQEAFELAAREPFDLLLTDLRMPRLGGWELIQRLRAARPELPVIVMTGYAPPGGAAALQQPGGGPMLLFDKPMDSERLLAALRRLTDTAD